MEEVHLIQQKFYYSLIQAEALVIPCDEIKMIILNYWSFPSSFTDSLHIKKTNQNNNKKKNNKEKITSRWLFK